jgi:hypothetical protein
VSDPFESASGRPTLDECKSDEYAITYPLGMSGAYRIQKDATTNASARASLIEQDKANITFSTELLLASRSARNILCNSKRQRRKSSETSQGLQTQIREAGQDYMWQGADSTIFSKFSKTIWKGGGIFLAQTLRTNHKSMFLNAVLIA